MPAFKSAPARGLKIYDAANSYHRSLFRVYVKNILLPEVETRILETLQSAAEQNPIYRWNIHGEDIDLKAAIRQFLYKNFHTMVRQFYYNADSHAAVAGYEGWYEFPNFGVLAFFTPDDGTPQSHPADDPLFYW